MSLSAALLTSSRRHVCATVGCVPFREYSDSNVKIIHAPTTASLKRGTGGRSSFNGIVATVFGASGFLGRYVVNELGKSGAQIIIPYRSEPDDYQLKKLKLFGDLGQILFQPFDLRDDVSIRKSVKYSNVVINLIGSHFETKNFSYEDVHVKGAQRIAVACKSLGIERLIHVSALNVTDKPKRCFMGKTLQFLPSKLKGECVVREAYPEATIIRPATIFGRGDRFITNLVPKLRRSFRKVSLWGAGKKTIKQPVFAKDIALAVLAIIKNPETAGKIYQAVGPERYLLSEIVNYCGRIAKLIGDNESICRDILADPIFISKLILHRYIYGAFFASPLKNLCFEQIEMEGMSDNVDLMLPTLEDLDIAPTRLEDRAEAFVKGKAQKGFEIDAHLAPYKPIVPPKPFNLYF